MSVDKEIRIDVFIAVLYAAPEYPDEVVQLCLELANRRPEAEAVRLRREKAQEEERKAIEELPAPKARFVAAPDVPLTPEHLLGPPSEPWPTGPKHRVDESFQEACLDRWAILDLVLKRPDEALEIQLAAIVEHPRQRRWDSSSSLRDTLGLDDTYSCDPAFYYQGPFWNLLRFDPTTAEFALTLIINVVNFATERWQDRWRGVEAKWGSDGSNEPSCVTVPSTSGLRKWLGDWHVLGWLDGWRTCPNIVSSMLMAVEKWLYDECDTGRRIDRWVNRILCEGKSVALLGVLLQVGKYKPDLLATSLRPLLGVWEIYAMEPRLRTERSRAEFWRMDWLRYGEDAWNSARDWHCMPHRKTTILDHAVPLIFENETIRAAVVTAHQSWEKRLETETENSALRSVVNHIAFVTRYHQAKTEGGEKLQEFEKWVEEQRKDAMAAQETANEAMLPLTVLVQCRNALDDNRPLVAGDLPILWKNLQRLATLPADSAPQGIRAVDAVFAGVATLLVLHRAWVREDLAREHWCRDRLLQASRTPPERRTLGVALAGWDWDQFAAECGVVLLAENPADALARDLVLDGLSSFRYTTVAETMRRAYRMRNVLGREFKRMRDFVAEWSACCWALRASQEWRLDTERLWKEECIPKLKSFATGEHSLPAVHCQS
jgi:hypothetical protein